MWLPGIVTSMKERKGKEMECVGLRNNTIVIKLYCDLNVFTFNYLCFCPVNHPRILADVKSAI